MILLISFETILRHWLTTDTSQSTTDIITNRPVNERYNN